MTPRSSYLKSSSRRLLVCRIVYMCKEDLPINLCSGLIVMLVLRKLTRICELELSRFSSRYHREKHCYFVFVLPICINGLCELCCVTLSSCRPEQASIQVKAMTKLKHKGNIDEVI